MRNLLGRLNARSPEDLTRIASAWQVVLTANDRLAQVSQLYRAITDPRTVRDIWERLPEDERAVVRLLAVGEETALTLPAIAAGLGASEAVARQTVTRLYYKGIVAREGDDDPLPVGSAPRLFMPRELTLLFRRVQDEIEAGDLSTTPLRALLSLLDDREIEEAAEGWGLRVIPGLRGREELTRQLLNQIGDAERVASVVAKRGRDAALIWRRLQDEPDGGAVALSGVAATAALATDDARQAQRLRQALAELEEALLVWHTYRSDGSRWLFIPAEIRAPRPPAAPDLPPLAPIAAATIEAPAGRHPDALAWDLLTFLRALSGPDSPRVHRVEDLPRGWRRALNRRLWRRGADLPPTGYLEFLADLALAEGLLHGGDPATEEPLTLSPAARLWRDRSFPDQTARLRWWWLASADWIEGSARDEVEVWGPDWPGFRRKLLASLAGLDEGIWYPLESVTAWLAARDPEMLGATFTVATARQGERGNGDDAARRRAAIAEVAAVTITTAGDWFGLVDVVGGTPHPRALRLTPAGVAAARGQPVPPSPPGGNPPLAVLPSLEIQLRDPTPLRVWSLLAFAEGDTLGQVSSYRLTEESVARALSAGFDVRQIAAFLANQSGAPLPEDGARTLEEWGRGYRRVRLRRAILATPDDPALLEELGQVATASGGAIHAVGDALLIELPAAEDESDPEAAFVDRLRDRGLMPQWARPGAPRRIRRDEQTPGNAGG